MSTRRRNESLPETIAARAERADNHADFRQELRRLKRRNRATFAEETARYYERHANRWRKLADQLDAALPPEE